MDNLRRFGVLTLVTAGLTYLLIVFGGIVRITGSGMGCGDDWPLCNGRLIPPLNDATVMIEWGHRLAAMLIGFSILGVGIVAFRHRREPEFVERGIMELAAVAVGLLIVVVLFGRATVQMELPPTTVVLHLALASTLLAVLIVAALRALAWRGPAQAPLDASIRWAFGAAALGLVVLIIGGLVATTGAAPLCSGFPLCNGQLFPSGGGLVHLHWTHRLLAYALAVVVTAGTIATLRHGSSRAISLTALAALALVVVQIAVGATMVTLSLPAGYRAAHLAVGVALWSALVCWAYFSMGFYQRSRSRSAVM